MEMSLDSPPVSSLPARNVTVADLAAAQSGRRSSLRCFVTARGGRSAQINSTVSVFFDFVLLPATLVCLFVLSFTARHLLRSENGRH